MSTETNGHAVVGVMVSDEVLLRVFTGTDSLAAAVSFCETLREKPDWESVVTSECQRLQQCSSEVMGLTILQLLNGVPQATDHWYGVKKGKRKDA